MLLATDTINLFTRAGKLVPSSVATQGDTLTALGFSAITKNKREEVWAFVSVCRATHQLTAWLPAAALTTFTIPDRWTRYVLPAPFLKKNFSFKSCAIHLIPLAALLLFGLVYTIIAWVKKRKHPESTEPNVVMSLLRIMSIITGIALFLLIANGNILRHFYYNPNLFSWGELPLSMILLLIFFAIIVVMTSAAIVTAFRKFKRTMAIYHAFGYLSTPVAFIVLTVAICSFVLLAILIVVGICILVFFFQLLSSTASTVRKVWWWSWWQRW
jgi:hypothetical protein